MSYQKPSKRPKGGGPPSQSQEYASSMTSSNNTSSESVQHPNYPTAPAAILPSSSGNSDSSGSSTNEPGNMRQGQAPQRIEQAQQRQLISDMLNAAMGSSSAQSTNQQSGLFNSAQVLLTQLQSIVGTTRDPNELLLQQLQQLIQPQTHHSEAPGTSRFDMPNTNTQSSIESDPPAEPEERKAPAPGNKGASQAEATEEAQPSAMVPCRARGMPPEHNASSAHFVVSHDIKHGSNLYCSFPACRNEGVKFCYCSHCGIPVAKRNFRQRHDHASSKKTADDLNEEQVSGSTKPTSQLPASPVDRKEAGRHDSEFSNNANNGDLDAAGNTQLAPMKSLSFQTVGKNVSSESEGFDPSKTSREKQARWASLLRKRPRDVSGDEMSAWLISVLEVSNLEKPGGASKTSQKNLSREGDDLAATETPSSGNGSSERSSEHSERSSEHSEESTFESSEGASSDTSEYRNAGLSSQIEDSSSDSNASTKFVNQSQLVERGVVKTESGIVSAYGVSTESSGPTDQSGGVDTTTSGTNEASTSGSGTNSMGGSSSDSDNGSNNELGGTITQDRKRPPVNEENTDTHRAPMKKRKQNLDN